MFHTEMKCSFVRVNLAHDSGYGGRFVSKLHHTIAKLERIFIYATFAILGYALFIWVYTFHLGMQLFGGMYGGRFVSKLHHTIAKLERILFMPLLLFWGIHFSFGYATFWGYALSIWVYTFYLGMHFLFGYALFIWVCTFRPSNAHALICTQRR